MAMAIDIISAKLPVVYYDGISSSLSWEN